MHATQKTNGLAPRRSGQGWMVLAIGTVVAIAVAVICAMSSASRGRHLLAIPVIAVPSCLANLAGFWLAFGSRWARFAVALLFTLLAAWLLSLVTRNEEFVAFLCFLGGIVVVVAATGFVLQVFNGRLTQSEGGREALQFGLRHIFLATTLVAIGVTVIRVFGRADAIPYLTDLVGIISLLVGAISLGAVVSIWALFGQRLAVVRLGALGCFTILCPAAVVFLNGGFGFWMPIIVVQQTLTIAALICVRSEGYRFVKQ